jgi:UDPglucose 6-dehydrogenase
MKITIAGYGFVGKAHNILLKDNYNIQIVDPKLNSDHVAQDTDGVIICVATPQQTDATCNMQHVFEVMNDVPVSVPVLIKSTISIEGWQQIKKLYPEHKVAFSPEFLRAASAVEDLLNTRHIYMGGDEVGFWHTVFRVAINDSTFTTEVATVEELILAKYFRNSFLAIKVAFFNQVYDLCDATGINYDIVKHMIAKDTRIGSSHTEITQQRGFGGHCFIKDTNAIVQTGKNVNIDLTLIEEAVRYNSTIRKSL